MKNNMLTNFDIMLSVGINNINKNKKLILMHPVMFNKIKKQYHLTDEKLNNAGVYK